MRRIVLAELLHQRSRTLALIGAAGSLLGAGLGLAGVAQFTDALPGDLLATTALAGAVGTALPGLAALAPAAWLRRLAPVPLLAAE